MLDAPRRLVAEGLRFGLVGGVATLVHVSVFVALIELSGMPPFWANFPAFAVAVTVGFGGHFGWTFRHQTAGARDLRGRSFFRFAVVALYGLAMNSLVVLLVVDLLARPYAYAVVLMLTVVPAMVFALSKYWAFAPSR